MGKGASIIVFGLVQQQTTLSLPFIRYEGIVATYFSI